MDKLNIIVLILWIVAGVLVIISKEPTLFQYILCWVNLILYISISNRRKRNE